MARVDKIKNLTGKKIMNVLGEHSDIYIDFLVEFDMSAFGKDFMGCFDCYMELLFFLEEIFAKRIELLTIEEISPYIKPYVLKEVQYFERI